MDREGPSKPAWRGERVHTAMKSFWEQGKGSTGGDKARIELTNEKQHNAGGRGGKKVSGLKFRTHVGGRLHAIWGSKRYRGEGARETGGGSKTGP